MTTPAVDTVEQIDAQWLTAGLRDGGIDATVRSVASEPVGTGQMGSCFRLRIDYAAGDGPQRLIVKLPAADLNSRAAGSLSYRCETSFYREFAHLIRGGCHRSTTTASAGWEQQIRMFPSAGRSRGSGS
jgi:hypothetical protein